MKADWTRPYPGYRIVGPLYSVGTEGLGMFLVATDEGSVLINTGVGGSAAVIRANMASLGIPYESIQLLLTMQSHHDHTTDLALIKGELGIEMWAMKADVRVLEDGGFSDPHFGGEILFPPVKVDRALSHGDTIDIGDCQLRVHEHPGHTEGSASYTMTVVEDGQTYDVAIVNMATVNAGKRFVDDPTYPRVKADFELTFERQKAMRPDIWVAAHSSHYDRDAKYTAGQAYDPTTFMDPTGYRNAIDRLERRYLELLSAELAEMATD